jgi:hypothetical protein
VAQWLQASTPPYLENLLEEPSMIMNEKKLAYLPILIGWIIPLLAELAIFWTYLKTM